ncbi:hypothetical protein [Marinobacter sp. ELB17]|uniref:hypothetical protein n=1 Tax=Marinobacter sp. ELB17 TaxID=270374 RepID=UPI0000F36DBF|nr:hypothetical protein [Marinobacter sp. ELB17]EBA01747.1 hypothetical protein MELB17_03175 [Marinobacter sp. ELB17]
MNVIVSRVHQGRYDSEKSLLNLRDNAINNNRIDVLDAVNQRLKKCHPKIYERLVGPLHERRRDKKFKCYCNNPKSLHAIYQDIVTNNVHYHSLMCDACWQEDIAKTWGYYGWASKLIPQKIWNALCEERAYDKFVE